MAELRQVAIEEYWPLIVKNTDEFQQIAVAENPEFNMLVECIYRVLEDGFIADATEYGVERWEKIIGISPAPGATLDERKATILYYLSVKLPYTWRVLKQMLTDYIGGGFVMDYVNDEGKLVIHTDRISDDKLQTIQDLLARVLPQNIEVVQYNQSIDIPWRDWTPGFTQVDFLENTSTSYVRMNCLFESNGAFELTFSEGDVQKEYTGIFAFNASSGESGAFYDIGDQLWPSQTIDGDGITGIRPRLEAFSEGRVADYHKMITFSANEPHVFLYKDRKLYFDGVYKGMLDSERIHGEFTRKRMALFCAHWNGYWGTKGRIYGAKLLSSSGTVSLYLVPALDPTGTPCMYDTVTRTPFYNQSSGDFLYPGAEQAAAAIMTLDLDAKFYAKLTATGVRRLYHVPAGCTMTMDEYAAANGFKELVEPPMPLEGYWTPEWRETDTQLICDWVETEPPAEEETTYEEVTEND